MKGLLMKDIRLTANMKNSLLFILLIAVGLSAYMSNASFLVMYLGLIGTSFTSSTLSYDEFDNGYAFLFSLPVTRRGYAVEKYVFGLLMCTGGWLLGTALSLASGLLKGGRTPGDIVLESLIMLPMVLILLSVLLPFHLKFGGEKGRLIMIGAAAALFFLLVLTAMALDRLGLNLDGAWESLPSLGMGAVIGVVAIFISVGILVLLLSCRISISIMEKKEF